MSPGHPYILNERVALQRSIPGGTEPFAGPIRMRDKLVYGSLPDLRASIVWDTCIRDGPDLQVLLRDLRATL